MTLPIAKTMTLPIARTMTLPIARTMTLSIARTMTVPIARTAKMISLLRAMLCPGLITYLQKVDYPQLHIYRPSDPSEDPLFKRNSPRENKMVGNSSKSRSLQPHNVCADEDLAIPRLARQEI